jgi:site-specific DNA-methyltransferase (adenine-specific)
MFRIVVGDCRQAMKEIPDNSIDSIVTDPPYELGFMGKGWDKSGIANDVTVWQECLRVLKPGGHLLAFGGTRTYHRMASAVEDAGFEIRDMVAWLYGSGFPKSMDVSKAIDKAVGAEREKVRIDAAHVRNPKATGRGRDGAKGATRPWIEAALERGYHEKDSNTPVTEAARQWQGWGTALKPAHEPIVLARKPFKGTVAANVLEFGTGAINVDGCRVAADDAEALAKNWNRAAVTDIRGGNYGNGVASGVALTTKAPAGRWPANVIHDGSAEVVELFPAKAGAAAPVRGTEKSHTGMVGTNCYGEYGRVPGQFYGDGGSAARFFYCSKASKKDRDEGLEDFEEQRTGAMQATADGSMLTGAGNERTTKRRNHHPTVKPVDLMRYLCRLITPPGGTVLDPFMGSGSTGKAAMLEGFEFIGIELSDEYAAIAKARIANAK